MSIIKVSGTSRTSAVAGAIAGVFRENKRAEVQAIGAIAVNQAIKALALAKGYLKEDGYDIIFYARIRGRGDRWEDSDCDKIRGGAALTRTYSLIFHITNSSDFLPSEEIDLFRRIL